MKMFLSHVDTPLGAMLLVTDVEQAVCALDFADHDARLHRGLREHYGAVALTAAPAPAAIADAMARYFAGELQALDTLPIVTAGSELQRRVWAALRRIPAGTATSHHGNPPPPDPSSPPSPDVPPSPRSPSAASP